MLETCVIQASVRHMGAVNNLSQLVEKFDGADSGADVSLLGFFPPFSICGTPIAKAVAW